MHTPLASAPPPFPPLGVGALLIRAITARQILAGLHTQLQRRLIPDTEVCRMVDDAERRALTLLDSLPPNMTYSRAQYVIHLGQSPLLLALHVMRNTAHRHLSLLRIAAAQQVGGPNEADVPTHRAQMIADAKRLSAIFRDALELGVPLDPQMAMHAYNGFEILLYQPVQSIGSSVEIDISHLEIQALLTPFVDVIRRLARVSHLVWLIYPETINRMIRKGYVDGLTNDDIMAVLKKLHSMSDADTEFDFEDSFWRYEVSLARLHGVQPPQGSKVSLNEALLELHRPGVSLPPQRAGIGDIFRNSLRTENTATTAVLARSDTGSGSGQYVQSDGEGVPRAAAHEDLPSQPGVAQDRKAPLGLAASAYPASTYPSALDITPIVRLQTMFQEVRSRAASPARSPLNHMDEQWRSAVDASADASDGTGLF